MNVHVLGIDIGKTVFHLAGLDESGKVVVKKQCSRSQLLRYTANLSIHVIGMEACPGAHYLARELNAQGHEARLMPAQYVKPFVKTNKNDFIDAVAIAEAVQRPTMRFVPAKTDDQLDLQALHRVRTRWIRRRTSLINQIRGLMLERGITVRKGPEYLRKYLPGILEDAEAKLTPRMRLLVATLKREWEQLESQILTADEEINRWSQTNESCRRLQTVPGIGPITATALVAAIGNGNDFRRGRDLAAWLGLVPRQYSTGGKQRLLGISKRGDPYLRQLFVHGARGAYHWLKRDQLALGRWLEQLESRSRRSTSIVALANKLARIAWAVLTTGQPYCAAA
jgi:transposase